MNKNQITVKKIIKSVAFKLAAVFKLALVFKLAAVVVTTFLLTLTAHSQTTNLAGYNTFVYTPPNPFNAPVLIAFHGNGEGTNLLGNGLPQLLNAGFIPPKNVYIICPQERWGAFNVAQLPSLLKEFKKKYTTADTATKYITGYSAGGSSTMEAAIYKPKMLLPMSAAGGGASLVNFIAQNKIPIVHWVGQNEADNIGWTLYQINAKAPNIAKTIIRSKIGHCCWNDIYKSNEFWDLIQDNKPHKIVEVNGYFYSIASTSWTVKENTTGGKVITSSMGIQVQNKGMVTLENSAMILTIHFKEPEPIYVCYEIQIDGKNFQLLRQGSKHVIYGGIAPNMTIKCANGATLTINKTSWSEVQ